MLNPKIFKAYDIRGVVPDELDEDGISEIAKSVITLFGPKSIQVGRDMRVSSESLHEAFSRTLLDYGVDVVDLGTVSTDMLYFAAGTAEHDLAVTISASHNPKQFNGLKIVKKGAVGVSGETGIYKLRDIALKKSFVKKTGKKGKLSSRDIMDDWVSHVLSFVNIDKLSKLSVVIDAGNGMAGHFLPHIERWLPWKVERMYYELDGTFPNHPPSPLEKENLRDVIKKVKATKADLGMAFDGDGDRVFLTDEKGQVLTGTVMTAMIADNLLKEDSCNTVLYNAIVGRIVPEIVTLRGGEPCRVKVGHATIKQKMREHNAIFAGEHSGHYYFRDNFFADSAIIAALLVTELLSQEKVPLSVLAQKYKKYSQSGELNFRTDRKEKIIKDVEKKYSVGAKSVDHLDGLSVWLDTYWFNLRPSNTEPLLRLNVEGDNRKIVGGAAKDLTKFIASHGAVRAA